MPISTKIQHRVSFFNNWNHMGIVIERFHERVDIQFAESRCELRLRFRTQRLIPKNQKPMLEPSSPKILNARIRQRRGQIDTADFCANRTQITLYLHHSHLKRPKVNIFGPVVRDVNPQHFILKPRVL